MLKVIVHPKMKILSFTHLHVFQIGLHGVFFLFVCLFVFYIL